MPKFQKSEARTGIKVFWKKKLFSWIFKGAGGGYNERDNVEYNERQDVSDSEYDEVNNLILIFYFFEIVGFSLDVRKRKFVIQETMMTKIQTRKQVIRNLDRWER